MDEYRRTNLDLWNEWTRIHVASEFYNVEGFREGGSSLLPLELEELGNVAGKRLLHLQCHFGMDTLSLARMGAEVTGVDFSPEAIEAARRLAAEVDVDATFVQSDIYDLADVAPPEWDGAFDIVFVTYGAVEWLHDLRPWADLIARFLRPGGTFYMAKLHPFSGMLELEELPNQADDPAAAGLDAEAGAAAGDPPVADAPTPSAPGECVPSRRYRLVQTYGYFPSEEPQRFDVQGSYADPAAEVRQKVCYGWTHPVGEVLGVLMARGLHLESFNEHPFSCAPYWPQMKKLDDGLWWLLDENGKARTDLPFLYSLRARKPG
jgi:SAM-dependent methyltransferase